EFRRVLFRSPVEGVAVDIDAELVGDCRQVQQAVGGAGDGRVDQDGVFQAVHGHDVGGLEALLHQLHRLLAGAVGVIRQVRGGGGQQGAAGQGQAHGLSHDLHGGGGADEAAGAAAGAGVLLGPVELVLIDFAPLVFGAVHTQLLQRQQVGTGAH